MDFAVLLFFGAIGLVVGIIGTYIVMAARQRRATEDSSSTAHINKPHRLPSLKELQVQAYTELSEWYNKAETIEEHRALLLEIERRRSELGEGAYTSLTSRVQQCSEALEKRAAAAAAAEQHLVAFRELRRTARPEDLFRELHLINTTEGGVITYNDLNEYGEKEEVEWFDRTYETLLQQHLGELLVAAQSGAPADYERVTTLWEQLAYFRTEQGDDRKEFVTKHLGDEWLEMIVRCKQELYWEDDLFPLDDIDEEGYATLIRKAREEHDFLSLRLVLLFGDEYHDLEFTKVFRKTFMQDFRDELDAQRRRLGYVLDDTPIEA